MKAEHWQQINNLFHSALEREPGERAVFLADACAGDERLRREVESLIASHEQSESFIESLAPELAAGLLAENQARLMMDQSISHYKIKALLGAGGMGEVYLAQDTHLSRRVALKLLPAEFTTDLDRLHRFEREARAASALNHPNIITIHEIGQIDRAHFIVTEFIEGQTLHQQITETKMRLREALDVAAQVASALEAAHKAGIVHRDIKPENIMLRPDGLVKVLDFGLAKLTEAQSVEPGAEATTLAKVQTKTGLVMGTVTYMSPEQARGLAVDARSDIFSLGAVIYEMVAGRVPFDGATTSDVIVSILEKEPPPLYLYVPEVPSELERIVKKALAKDREGRYQTVKGLLIDLKTLKEELELQSKLAAAPHISLKDAASATTVAEQSIDTDGKATNKTGELEPTRAVSSAEYLISEIKSHKRSAIIATASITIAVAVLGYYSYFGKGGEAIDSVAVLPFVNGSNDADAEYLSDGISDTIIDSLSQLPNLKKVIPLSSVLRFKGKQIDPQAVGRELNVRAVLAGRLALRGDDLLISTELIDVKDNKRLWGGQYDRKLADMVNLQSEIAQEISGKLRLKLTGEQNERLAKPQTKSAEAYQLYLQGRYYWHKITDEGRVKSGEYFQKAIEKDPNYALGYVGLARYYGSMANFGQMPPTEAWRNSEEAAVKALAIDDMLGEAHLSLAGVRMWYDWDWRGAEREIKRAIELDPKFEDVESHAMHAEFMNAMGRFDEAIAEATRAQEMDPLSKHFRSNLGYILYNARRYDEAIVEYRKELEKDPNSLQAHLGLGEVYVKQGSYEEAVAEMVKARPLVNLPRQLARIGYVYAAAGKKEEATKILNEVKGQTREKYNLATFIAAIYAALGDKEQAFAWLRKGCDEHQNGVKEFKVSPRFDTLRSDPRFTDLLRRVKLAP